MKKIKTEKLKINKKCTHCGGNLKNPRQPKILTPDTKKMLNIMKRHKLTMMKLAEILGIGQSTVSNWFHEKTNIKGIIKKRYFEMLKLKGYK